MLRSWDKIKPYKAMWDSILRENNTDIVFMTFEWLYLWWKYHGEGKRLFFLVAKDDNNILGFCPLMEVPARGYKEIRFIGGNELSYMGFPIKSGFKCAVLGSILDYLIGLKGNHMFNIHGIFKDADEYNIFKDYLDKTRRKYLKSSLECYFIGLHNRDYNSYIAGRFGRNSIRTMERKEKRLARLGELSFKPFTERDGDIERIFDIHEKRWQRKVGHSKFSKGRTREFFKELALSDKMPFETSVDIIDVDGTPISFIYGFYYNGRYTFYRIGHDDNFAIFSPGELVLRKKLKDCFEKGYRVFDFGVGYEPYKAAWTDEKADMIGFVFPGDGVLVNLIFNIQRLVRNLRQFLKRDPRIYNFVKYKLGKFKMLIYSGNAKKTFRRGIGRLKNRVVEIVAHIYSSYDYYIVYRPLISPDKADCGIYTVEEASIRKLGLLTEKLGMEPRDVHRRFLDENRCILVWDKKGIYSFWIDTHSIKIPALNFNWNMEGGSTFIYQHFTGRMRSRISHGLLNSVLSYLNGLGYSRCYLVTGGRSDYLMNLTKDVGFSKFKRLRLKKRFGRMSYNKFEDITE